MIKKIDANKYGVVRYAISSIEDIADLPREVSVGSEAILVNEDGEKKFRLGSDGWVEVVEVKEYDEDKLRDMLEDAKVGYGGIEYETLEERLDRDFDNVYSVLDNRTYVEYEGCRITAKDSLDGLQKETVVKGRTLQNIVKSYKSSEFAMSHAEMVSEGIFKLSEGTDVNQAYIRARANNHLYKTNTTYTVFVDILENTTGKKLGISNINSMIGDNYEREFQNLTGVSCVKFTTTTDGLTAKGAEPIIAIYFGIWSANDTSGEFSKYIKFKYWIFEGDYKQAPLEELPFIEGIESVGDKSKNLFNPNNLKRTVLDLGKANQECVERISLYRCSIRNIPCKPNTEYTFKSDKDFYIALGSIDSNNLALGDTGWRTGKVGYTYITPSNAVELAMNFQNESNTMMTPDDVRAINLQLEEGSRATAYEPYYDGYKISGKSCGKNLIDLSKMIPHAKIDHKIEGNKVILVGNEPYPYVLTKIPIDVRMISGKRLRISADSITSTSEINQKVRLLQLNVTYLDGSMAYHGVMTGKKDQIFTLGKNIAYAYVCFYTNNTADYEMGKTVIINPMLEIQEEIQENDSTSISYESYKETTYSYILDEPLHSLPDGVCDEIDLEKGVVTRRVGKYTFTGDESTFGEATEVTGDVTTTYLTIHDRAKGKVDNIICNSLACYPYTVYENIQGILVSSFSCFVLSFKNGTLKSNDIEGIRQWLKDNPTTVYYELANPTTEYLIKDDKFVTLPNGVKDEVGRIVTRKVGKVVLNGSGDWKRLSPLGSTDTIVFEIHLPNSKPSDNNKIEIMCDTLTVYKANDLWYYEGADNICSHNATNGYQIRINKNELGESTVEEFRKWLSRNPVTVYYQLETPYIECSYEEYPTLPNGVKDEVSYNSVLRRVGKVVVDGSQVLTRSSTNSNKTKTTHFSVNGISSNSPYGICDKLPTTIDASLQVYEIPCMKLSSANKADPPYTLWLNIDRSNADTVGEAYEYFRNNPHTVWYELITPYVEPINLDEVILDTIRLKSYEPITHITSDNYLPPTIKTQVPSDFNAVVLGLKSNNEALASQVMSLRQTNDELEATNREQDDVIDVTLLALDEVYGMIDEGEIETMSVGSPMVNVYVKMIKRGIKTLDEVPAKYRAEVEELI